MIHVKHLQRRWMFAALDLVGMALALAAAMFVRKYIPLPVFDGLLSSTPWSTTPELFLYVTTMSFGFLFVLYVFGIYDLWATSSLVSWIQRLLPPNIMVFACAFAGLYLLKTFDFPRSFIVTAAAINLAWGLLWRAIYFRGVEDSKSQVVLIGSHKGCLDLAREFEHPPFKGRVEISALFTNDTTETADSPFPINRISEFQQFSKDHPYTSVIVVPPDYGTSNIFSEILSAAKRGVPVYTMPTAYEILLGRLRHVQVNDLPLLELRLEPPSALFASTKRFLDFVLALLLMALLSPVMAMVALLIKMDSPGPVFYTQERVGLLGRHFRVIKFRTMGQNAEADSGPVFASKKDPRVTRVGRFLRVTRLDELPQLVNILNGDMSFVGPRPERPVFVEKFEQAIPGYSERTRIRPGLTGLAQVSGTYESGAETKLKYDLAYMANQSLLLDIQILIRTAKSVLLKAGQ